ncbi:MAG: tetratricopeptide repeat protein [Acidobacteriia bacterium]|nr:tetratricopeptide repeat protein [Terriglobia bacterium]
MLRALVASSFILWSTQVAAGQSFDYARVERALQEHNVGWAQEELETRLRAVPGDGRAHMLAGILYDEQNQPGLAEEHLRSAAGLLPQDPAVHINLGKHYAQRGAMPSAEAEFRAAAELNPRSIDAFRSLGLLLLSEGKPALALPELQKAAGLSPKDLPLWLQIFEMQLHLKRFEEARRTAIRVEKLSPPGAATLSHAGAMQAEAGDYKGAIVTLRAALERDSRSYDIAYNLALAYFKDGAFGPAADALEKLRKERDTAEINNLAAEAYEEQAKYLEALHAFQRAAELEPSNENYRFDYLHELLAHQNFEAAIPPAVAARRDFPGSMKLSLALGLAYFGAAHHDQASEVLIQTAHTFPGSDLPLYFLTFFADASHQRIEETEALLNAYIQDHPQQHLPYSLLGHLVDLNGDPLRALPLLEKSITLAPGQPDAQFDLGNVSAELKQWHKAVVHYREATRLKPDFDQAWYRLALALQKDGDADGARVAMAKHQKLRQQAATTPAAIFLYKLTE